MSDTVTGSGFSVPSFDDVKKPRNPRKKAAAKAALGLVQAVDFISLASEKDSKIDWQQFGRFVAHFATASNGVLRAGHPIEEDLTICPHLGMLRAALAKSGASVAMTILDQSRLSVVGGKVRYTVPCALPDTIPPIGFDPAIAPLGDAVKQGFKALLKLAKDEAETLHESTLLLRANTVVGCNGQLAMEYWHGVDLPPALNVPQAFCKAVVSVQAPLVGFGWTEGRSITFHFEGGGWIATQLYEGEWPNVDAVLNTFANLTECPAGLFDALDKISDFSKDGAIHFHDDKLKTTYARATDEQQGSPYGASHDVPGLFGHHSFTAKLLKLAKPGCAMIDYTTNEDRMVFYNEAEMIRGVLMKRIA